MLFFSNKKTQITNTEVEKTPHPTLLIILDGFGISPITEGNAIRAAKTPNIDYYQKYYPKSLLHASGNEVGLPYGEAGNSEVGHLNIGAGRIVYQPLLRVSRALDNKGLDQNPVAKRVITHLKKHKGNLHLIGLLSAGGVHSHIEHLMTILDWCQRQKIMQVYLHLMTDGRDSLPAAAETFYRDLEDKIKTLKISVEVASVSGRLYGMDRDTIWSRTKEAYDAIFGTHKNTAVSFHEVIQKSYARGLSDEFIQSHTIVDKKGKPIGIPSDGDAIMFFNIRPDRSRQLAAALCAKQFSHFKRKTPSNVYVTTLTEYDSTLNCDVVFPEPDIINSLGEAVAATGRTQLRIAETQKYAHVTYFLNGGTEKSFKNEKRILIPSLKVKNFAQAPDMSTDKVCKRVLVELDKGVIDFYAINFANADMVGHTGDFRAAIKGIQCIDKCLGEIISKVLKIGGAVCITADHGNAEEMLNFESGGPDTEHNIYPVPFMVIANHLKRKKATMNFREHIAQPQGTLSDVAPTVLSLMNIEKPIEMSGRSLLDSML